MHKPKFFNLALAVGVTLGVLGGYTTQGDYVGVYSVGALGLGAGFMVWLVVAHLIDD